MESDFIAWITTQAGVSGLAAFAIWMLIQAYKDKQLLLQQAKLDAEQYALVNREDKQLVVKVLEEAIRGYTVLDTKIDAIAAASQRQEAWVSEQRARNAKST
jgi:hypothetical protein